MIINYWVETDGWKSSNGHIWNKSVKNTDLKFPTSLVFNTGRLCNWTFVCFFSSFPTCLLIWDEKQANILTGDCFQCRLRKSQGNHPVPAEKSDNVHFIPCASDPLEAASTNQTLKWGKSCLGHLPHFSSLKISHVMKSLQNFFRKSFCVNWPDSGSLNIL